ncbi:MAG: hypothetical protein CMH36_00700 [Microbacterium sp.]|nr:ROK family protein [Microbacterium ginsengisoli]KJL39565.1 N-acetyl-D-glucosamine kinase [Microbacterium ginsengisoli]MAL05372.1 hypothetical protein [Microbacterium sp.]MBN9207531.1 ROK family protein [Microbacterium ginsengisoli]HAN25611.1 hypothetical protein [Microbacterium ginsengisoli]
MSTVALAVDLGGTKIEAALVEASGLVRAVGRTRRPTGPDTDPARLDAAAAAVVSAAVAALGPDDELVGVGIGAAGPIDAVRETIDPVNMPGVHGFALADAVRRVVGRDVPVRLRHDGGCIALAENWIGATAGTRASMSIVVSTGVGGGLVVDGALVGGGTGNAGHIGQVSAPAGFEGFGPTLEHVASGPSSVRWAQAQGWGGERGEDLARDAAAGDPVARAAIERSARAVGIVLADAATLIDLEAVAIGGGFSTVTPDYIDLVQASLRESAALPFSRATRVVPSGLAGDGPLIGAAALVLR